MKAKIISIFTQTEKIIDGVPTVKIALVNCMINCDYQKSVNRQRKKENQKQDFQSSEPKWGERSNCIVTHGDKKYLQVRVLSSEYTHFQHGKEVEIKENTSYRTRQGVKKPVIIRNYSFSNILSVRSGGKTTSVEEFVKNLDS